MVDQVAIRKVFWTVWCSSVLEKIAWPRPMPMRYFKFMFSIQPHKVVLCKKNKTIISNALFYSMWTTWWLGTWLNEWNPIPTMEDGGISKNESVHRQFHLDETSFFSFFIRLVSSHHACSLPLHRDITIPGFVLGQTLLKLTINSKKKVIKS